MNKVFSFFGIVRISNIGKVILNLKTSYKTTNARLQKEMIYMDMKIRSTNGYANINSVSSIKNKNGDAGVQSIAMKTDNKSDIIKISAEGTFQAELDKETKAISEEISDISAEEKINSIKEQIDNGTYFVSSENIADAILGKLLY